MSTTIKTRTFSSVQDNRVVLSNSQFARPFNIPTWTTLRIALRLNMNNTASDLANAFFYVGLSSGSANKIMDATTTNWIGVKSNQASLPWTYYGGSPVEYYGPSFRSTKRVNTTTTDNATAITTGIKFALPADASLAKRVLMFVDISKDTPGAGTYTINIPLYFSSDAASVVDASVADFITQSEASTPAFANHIAGTSRTLAADESAGAFNHINIGWDQTTPTIEICDHKIFQIA